MVYGKMRYKCSNAECDYVYTEKDKEKTTDEVKQPTASALPAGTLHWSATEITKLSSSRISCFNSPPAEAISLDFSELEQTNSQKFLFLCAGF